MKRVRLDPSARKAAILDAAIQCASVAPYTDVTREAIGARAGCAPGTVSHYFSTMAKLRRALMREAVVRGVVSIIADGLARSDPQARRAAPDLLVKARQLLVMR